MTEADMKSNFVWPTKGLQIYGGDLIRCKAIDTGVFCH